ncbi:hypothetical protein FOMPIDRAFT_1050964 [Fomitopsis schrenkii]|uniref:Vacuolar membrane-associated protein IML1 n=1 Tax=Fomitopsis schrenkii TaxID=2126942 RepID=S8FKW7_FOMSC|nr:hypothetical protein FOMPIDRAFT_1050964 [Fomitopsis schrenkii]
MSSSRAESQASQYGRRRSNTAQSLYRPPPLPPTTPLKYGDTKTLTIWVHDPTQPPGLEVILNHAHWPGVAEGDMLADETSGFLFSVQKDEASARQQLSIPRPVAEKFGLRNHGEVTLTKIDKSKYCADFVELTFQDQYLGRNEMWRLGSHLVGQCIYIQQDISFIGIIGAKINAIHINGRKVPAAYVTPATKTVYRSLSAKVTIFIQVCRELWQFAGDGERYNEKIVHSFLPELFAQWNEAKTNHIVTIVLISRVFYDSSETVYAAGPLRQDDSGRWYKDFFKVITDLEVLYDWRPTLVDLKTSFWDFQHDILLAHHFHRAALTAEGHPDGEQVRLVGQLSYAHDGPLLEALNLGLNPTETHYIDRSLSLTGSSSIVITPGTGYFHVSKELLRLTTTRLLDQGFAVELVSLAKPPLHQSPIFSFQGSDPEVTATASKGGPRALDPLWADDEAFHEWDGEKPPFWWEPFWMTVSYWDKQMDQPLRPDRFVVRAKMHEIEMLGLLDHDVLHNIEIPFLPVPCDSTAPTTAEDADQFDSDIFKTYDQEPETTTHARRSMTLTSSTSGTTSRASTVRLSGSLRMNASNRVSTTSAFPSIEESPRNPFGDLPPERPSPEATGRLLAAPLTELSTSPSQSSMRSAHSSHSHKSVTSATSATSRRSRLSKPPPRGSTSMKSRLTPSWLFNPFRSGLSQPQTSPVSVSTSRGANSETQSTSNSDASSSSSSAVPTPESHSPEKKPVRIPLPSSLRREPFDEDTLVSRQPSPKRLSPINASPRDSFLAGRRRTISKTSSTQLSLAPSAPSLRTNPSKPTASIPYTLSSLARRWQHLFPQALSKHEIKWEAMIIPGCLPLTTEFFPSMSELETTYDVHPYEFVVDPSEMQSFLVRPPSAVGNADDVRRAWALTVMRGMVAVRLAQGFQFVVRPPESVVRQDGAMNALRRTRSYIAEDDTSAKPTGIADVLKSADDPIYLSMSNEIHRIAYIGDSVQVRRWVRTMPRSRPLQYQCLIWPKLGVGYTELVTSFVSHGLENYGWNRLDMLVAGYETQFNESIRYWRTRFVVIPTDDPPSIHTGPNGEELNDEEVRLLGIDKLAELFSKARWIPPEDRGKAAPPIRFLTTDLDPAASILDESLTAQLDEIHASGPLRKKPKSARDIGDMSLAAIAKAMREEDGVPIKEHRWHGRRYANSFTGSDFVSWLVREFRDVSTREQGTEWGAKLQEQGLFEHCRGAHGFLDGHYFYTLRDEYLAPMVPMTPRGGSWFRPSRHVSGEELSGKIIHYPGSAEKSSPASRKTKKRLILSQSMVIDIDPNKRSDQAESVILHHDIIHNPATCFHFELQWIGTIARCIDDLLRQWSRTIERYGLKLVEAYVSQICDIQDRNPFQSCFPLPLAEPPPVIPDIEKRVAEGVLTRHYFEYAILRKFGFVVDIEAASLYPDTVDVFYSYRRSPFKYSQWVHRSGVAFMQVLGGRDGFLFLTNRLMAPGRIGTALNYQRPAAAAEHIRIKLQRLCSDREALRKFYEEEIAQLPPVLEEPPPLRI